MENINIFYTLRLFVEAAVTLVMAFIVLGIKVPHTGFNRTKLAKYLLSLAWMLLGVPMLTYGLYKITAGTVFLSYLLDNFCYSAMLLAPMMILSEKYNLKVRPVLIAVSGLCVSLQCFFYTSFPFFGINCRICKYVTLTMSSVFMLYLIYEGIKRLRKCGVDKSVIWFWVFYFSVIAIVICYMLLLPVVPALDSITLYIKIAFILVSVLLLVQLFEYSSQLRQVSSGSSCNYAAQSISVEAEAELKANLEKWIAEKRFLEPDEGMEIVARQLGTDIKTLRTYFRMNMPSDFRTWRISLRIGYAKEKLHEDPGISVNRLSDISGFTTRSNFYLYFKKDTGMTPTEYKEKIICGNGCGADNHGVEDDYKVLLSLKSENQKV